MMKWMRWDEKVKLSVNGKNLLTQLWEHYDNPTSKRPNHGLTNCCRGHLSIFTVVVILFICAGKNNWRGSVGMSVASLIGIRRVNCRQSLREGKGNWSHAVFEENHDDDYGDAEKKNGTQTVRGADIPSSCNEDVIHFISHRPLLRVHSPWHPVAVYLTS